jgi:hypothetical protein
MKAPELKDRLVESEKLMKDLTKTWEEKLAETERVHMVCTLNKVHINTQCGHCHPTFILNFCRLYTDLMSTEAPMFYSWADKAFYGKVFPRIFKLLSTSNISIRSMIIFVTELPV